MSYKYIIYIILNLLLLVMVFMVAIENDDVWSQPIELVSDNQETIKKPAIKTEVPPPVGTSKEPASLRSSILISEKNIFSPERKDFPVLAAEKPNAATRPQVVLYGVTIAGEYQAASISSPGRSLRKGERETLTLKIGEKIGGYKLANIEPDRITMESNGDSFEVLLYDPRSPKKRMEVKTEVKPPPMISSTQPAPAPPGTPASASGTPPPLPSVEKPKELPRQQVAPPISPPTSPLIPRQRRRGTPVYPPTSPPTGLPGQAPQ